MITYAIGDIHGMSHLLEKAWDWISYDAGGEPHIRIITLGDYIDRGPNSRQVLHALQEAKKRCDYGNNDRNTLVRTELITLRGNHDDMMVKALRYRSKVHEDCWLQNGGNQTLDNYMRHGPGGVIDMATGLVPPSLDRKALDQHMDFIESMPLWFEDEHRIYVHAGLPSWAGSYAHPAGNETEPSFMDAMLWHRCSTKTEDYSLSEKMVVHGHTPVKAPVVIRNGLFLDTAACYPNGSLSVAKFIDGEAPTFKSFKNEAVQPVALGEHV